MNLFSSFKQRHNVVAVQISLKEEFFVKIFLMVFFFYSVFFFYTDIVIFFASKNSPEKSQFSQLVSVSLFSWT